MQGRANVSIGRCSSNREEDFITIRIGDDISSINIVEVKMSLAEFAQCITSMYMTNIPADFVRPENYAFVGKKMEVKTINLPLDLETFNDEFEKEVKPHEKDGWVADRDEKFNHYRLSKKGYAITFRRWVEVKAPEERIVS